MENEKTYHTQKKTLLLEGVLKAHIDERLTVRAIASKFGLSPTTVQRWIVNFAAEYQSEGGKFMKERSPQEPKSINLGDMAKLA